MSRRTAPWLLGAALVALGAVLWIWMGDSAQRATTVKIVGMLLVGLGMLAAAVLTARRARRGDGKP